MIATTKLKMDLTDKHIACPWHKEPFRKEWPLGFDVFVAYILEQLAECQELIDNCEDSPEAIMEALENKPACCWLDPSSLLCAYMNTHVDVNSVPNRDIFLWPRYSCQCCKEDGLGSECWIMNDGLKKISHICLQCFAENIYQAGIKNRGKGIIARRR
jgi:hypothetical protein